MLASALVLAFGLVILAAARLSGTPSAYGLAVFAGILFVAAGSAMHLGAITDELLTSRPGLTRVAVRLATWLGLGAGTAWLIGRTPGLEVLAAMMTVPLALATLGLVVRRRDAWQALPFLVMSGLLIGLLGPIWIARHGGP